MPVFSCCVAVSPAASHALLLSQMKWKNEEFLSISDDKQKLDPWRWQPAPLQRRYILRKPFDGCFLNDRDQNGALDIKTKQAVLHVSPSVVSLVSYHGDNMVSACSGTIIESKLREGSVEYVSTVLTSVSLFRSIDGSSYDPSNLKVIVNLWEGSEPCEGKVFGFDLYYKVAVVEIRSSSELPVAVLGHLNVNSTELGMQSLIALGRHYRKPHDLMAARGKYTRREKDNEPEEFLCSSCRISMIGIGGPLINNNGEVIGLNFYHDKYTPFLLVNIASKCLQHLNQHMSQHYLKPDRVNPWSGIKVSSLIDASVSLLEKVIRWHPNWREGVLVEQVMLGSPADAAGIRPVDVIIKCAGKSVTCPFEFFDIISEKAREEVEVTVARMDGNVDLKVVPKVMITDE